MERVIRDITPRAIRGRVGALALDTGIRRRIKRGQLLLLEGSAAVHLGWLSWLLRMATNRINLDDFPDSAYATNCAADCRLNRCSAGSGVLRVHLSGSAAREDLVSLTFVLSSCSRSSQVRRMVFAIRPRSPTWAHSCRARARCSGCLEPALRRFYQPASRVLVTVFCRSSAYYCARRRRRPGSETVGTRVT